MNFKLSLAALASLSLATGVASASTITGPYVDLGAGATLTQTQHLNSLTHSAHVGHAPGYSGYGAFGYGLGDGFRVELEGLYAQSRVNRVSPKRGADGRNSTYGGLLNVVYDIDTKKLFNVDSVFTPYVGVGAGYLVENYRVKSPVQSISGTQGGFGYQGIVGTAIDTGVPGLTATVDYRMIGEPMSRQSYHTGDVRFDHKFTHTFNVGLRYSFDTAPAAPQTTVSVAPPAPAPARTYLVFFDWDSSTLSTQAKLIVDKAAEATHNTTTTRVNVAGYADNTSIRGGVAGEQFNKNLSVKRAEAVEAELVKNGVPKEEILVEGLGDTVQFVKTAPNTREALNRRVVITLN